MNHSYVKNDGGKSKSKRSKQNNDCTVRALAIACNISYDEAYDALALCGRTCNRVYHISEYLKKCDWAKKISFPAAKGQNRMSIISFCNQFKEGVYICKVSKHVFVVINGVVHDLFENRDGRCVYTAWKVEYKKSEII